MGLNSKTQIIIPLLHHYQAGDQQFLRGSTVPINNDYYLDFFLSLFQIKSLSPAVVSHVKDIFNDMHGENIYYATIPGMIRRGDRIEIVQRIWLGQYEKMKTYYRKKGKTILTKNFL